MEHFKKIRNRGCKIFVLLLREGFVNGRKNNKNINRYFRNQ